GTSSSASRCFGHLASQTGCTDLFQSRWRSSPTPAWRGITARRRSAASGNQYEVPASRSERTFLDLPWPRLTTRTRSTARDADGSGGSRSRPDSDGANGALDEAGQRDVHLAFAAVGAAPLHHDGRLAGAFYHHAAARCFPVGH